MCTVNVYREFTVEHRETLCFLWGILVCAAGKTYNIHAIIVKKTIELQDDKKKVDENANYKM